MCSILSQFNPVYTLAQYFSNIHFNIILLSTRKSTKWALSFRISDKIIFHLSQECNILDFINLIVLSGE
jgi:hypothetical protein